MKKSDLMVEIHSVDYNLWLKHLSTNATNSSGRLGDRAEADAPLPQPVILFCIRVHPYYYWIDYCTQPYIVMM